MKHIKKFNLFEHIEKNDIYYHGTRSMLPFQEFQVNMDGSGLVSGGKKFGGFFFTSEKDNSLFYSENYICKVRIRNVQPSPLPSTHSPTVLKQAAIDKANYELTDIVDGSHVSDVVVVPYCNVADIEILGWEFVGDKESFFHELNKLLAYDEEEEYDYISQETIEDFFNMTGGGLDYALQEPVFKEYYESKR